MQYNEIEFGNDENRITIILLEETMGKGLMGMLSSTIFKENIALIIDEEHDDEDYTFACLGCGKDGVAPRVQMTKEMFDELKNQTSMAKTVVMHEVGHYYNSDIGNGDDNSEDRRRELVSQNKVCPKEIKADAFAVQYLGKDTVVAGLENLRDKILLDDVSFVAKQGEVTARVGPSGGGKTTVSRLAARFWDIGKGKITVGGMDISTIDPETLMSLYSIVFQDVTLFNNTVMENIRLGRKDATDEEVLEAAKLANVDGFAEKLPDKWNTNIGENGCELSGGERQRISIARAFLKDAPIILLDEATASLDVENETQIQTALSKLIKNKTVLIIAHRMRTVAGVDKVVVLSDGIVNEEGTPDELMKQDGIYKHMAELQTKSQSWTF